MKISKKEFYKSIRRIGIFFDLELHCDTYKKLILNMIPFYSKVEEKVKRLSSCLLFIIYNSNTELTFSLIKQIYYILFLVEINDDDVMEIMKIIYSDNSKSLYEKVSNIFIFLYNSEKENYKLFSFMLVNYLFIRNGKNVFSIEKNKKTMFESIVFNKSKTELIAFLICEHHYIKTEFDNLIINNNKILLNDLLETLYSCKVKLSDQYKVKHLSVYGSYTKKMENECSDLDVLIEFDSCVRSYEKKELFQKIIVYLQDKLNMKIDLTTIEDFCGFFKSYGIENIITVF